MFHSNYEHNGEKQPLARFWAMVEEVGEVVILLQIPVGLWHSSQCLFIVPKLSRVAFGSLTNLDKIATTEPTPLGQNDLILAM